MLTLFIVDNIKNTFYHKLGHCYSMHAYFFLSFEFYDFFFLFTMEHTTKKGDIKSIASLDSYKEGISKQL